MDGLEIRQRFIDYYENMGYRLLPRASLLDPSIPMSFVMSAGLVQVENSLARVRERKGNQFVLVQKCFRHFDLDKVGTDGVHLSLFEMPGAFVFGPDGKIGTVRRMFTLATAILGIDQNRIWASYFHGGSVNENDLPVDIITRNAWLEVGIPENRVVGLGPENNYWIQGKGIYGSGATRKCGPNTELFFDRGEDKACGINCRPGCKCGRFVEFSNSLFICCEMNEENGALYPIANPFTETVIGTERVAMIRQNVRSVFETEGYKPLIEIIHRFVRKTNLSEDALTSHEQVIADHIRGLYYLIADGAPLPGKDGRARIVKILIRRVLARLIFLDINLDEFLPVIVRHVSRVDSSSDDEREKQPGEQFTSYFLSESRRFSKTIERGQRQLMQLLMENGGGTLSGLQIVCLEKQWGLPSLLTFLTLQKHGLTFKESEYREALSMVRTAFSF